MGGIAHFRAYHMEAREWNNINDSVTNPHDAANWIILRPIGADRFAW